MKFKDTTHYDALSRAFHWLTAVVVGIAFVLGPGGFGRLMRQGVDPATHSDIVWHETLGVLVFVLTALRLLWVAVRPAAPRFDMPARMELAGKLAHLGLWLLLLAIPLTAMLALGSRDHPLTLLGGLRVEHLLANLPALGNSSIVQMVDWGDVHGVLGDVIIWLAGLHAVAAIYHHVMLKDGVLRSMLPR
jgi:cytochrome b561